MPDPALAKRHDTGFLSTLWNAGVGFIQGFVGAIEATTMKVLQYSAEVFLTFLGDGDLPGLVERDYDAAVEDMSRTFQTAEDIYKVGTAGDPAKMTSKERQELLRASERLPLHADDIARGAGKILGAGTAGSLPFVKGKGKRKSIGVDQAVPVDKARSGASSVRDAGDNPWNVFQRGNKGGFASRAEAAAAYKAAGKVRGSSPLSIPAGAAVKVQAKKGYTQIRFRWRIGNQRFDARWHTRTPGAPSAQGNTWVVERRTMGTPTQRAQNHILSGRRWVTKAKWHAAIAARKAGTATNAQRALLDAGHHSAK